MNCDYGETMDIIGAMVSLQPAAHMTGLAQVRIEHRGEIVVVSGDYKLQPNLTCTKNCSHRSIKRLERISNSRHAQNIAAAHRLRTQLGRAVFSAGRKLAVLSL